MSTATANPQRDRDGGRILVDQLVLHGVNRVFCVPGESYLPVLDALRDVEDTISLTVCRHEANAANMADAYGKLTGNPGVCIVTRGPGATQASVGLHTAYQDSTPMVLFVGQVQRGHLGREAFQEVDFRRGFGEFAKCVLQIEDPHRIPEVVGRAFHTAVSGRPGPVVVVLPEDVLDAVCMVNDSVPHPPSRPHPGEADMQRLRDLLSESSRPIVLLGGGAWSEETSRAVQDFVVTNDLPVATTFRRQDHIDNRIEQYVGTLGLAVNPALAQRVRDADLVIAIGARLGDATTSGYTLLEPPVPHQRLVHVHPDPDELGRVYSGSLLINAGWAEFGLALGGLNPVDASRWGSWRSEARQDYVDFLQPEPIREDTLDLAEVMLTLRSRLPDDAIITNGAGNYTIWVHRYLEFYRVRTQLAPTSGAMGYAVPAAVAAKAIHPERTVVGIAGDGCFLMSSQELATAVQYDLAPVLIVVNNGMYGTIRMHQERRFPGRSYGVDLVNPDFVQYARSFGLHAERVERTEQFSGALERALSADRAGLIELRTNPQQITPNATLSAISGS